MVLLPARDPKMYEPHNCHICVFKAARYIYKNDHWCRECLDKEQYPQLAHLTQEEREEQRRFHATHVDQKSSFLNTGNIEKKEDAPVAIGF